jgi:tetrahydromethanopterin S-methyltransferase subunit G
MDNLTPYLVTALIGLVAWIGARLWNKMDKIEVKVDDHNSATIQRLSRVETKVDGMEERVEHIERIVLKRA